MFRIRPGYTKNIMFQIAYLDTIHSWVDHKRRAKKLTYTQQGCPNHQAYYYYVDHRGV